MNSNERDLGDLEWLQLAIPIFDVERLRRVVSERIASDPRFYLEWDGRELMPTYWIRRTRTRESEALELWEAVRAAGEPIKKQEVVAGFFGMSFSDALTEAAKHFRISYSTLHRIVRPRARGRSRQHILALTLFRLRTTYSKDGDAEFRASLDRAVLGPKVGRVLREYIAYIEREIERLSAHRSEKHNLLLPKYLATTKNLDGSPRIGALWQARFDFHRTASALGAPASRARLGDLRVYDSLVGWRRFYSSLSKRQRRSFVKSGYRRERQLVEAELKLLRREIINAI